jgi:hypothetical protein
MKQPETYSFALDIVRPSWLLEWSRYRNIFGCIDVWGLLESYSVLVSRRYRLHNIIYINALDCLKWPELHWYIIGKLPQTFQSDPPFVFIAIRRGFHVGDPLFALTPILILGGDCSKFFLDPCNTNILTQGFIFALICCIYNYLFFSVSFYVRSLFEV